MISLILTETKCNIFTFIKFYISLMYQYKGISRFFIMHMKWQLFYAEILGQLYGILFNKWSLDYTFEAYWSTLIFSNSLQWDNILLNLDDILFICHLNAKVKMTGRSVDPGVMIKFMVYSKRIDFQIWSAFRNFD